MYNEALSAFLYATSYEEKATEAQMTTRYQQEESVRGASHDARNRKRKQPARYGMEDLAQRPKAQMT